MKRENNYDLLRLLAAFAVVCIHVNQYYCWIGTSQSSIIITNEYIFDVFTRFCVPCFLMISGAFLLYDKRNRNIGYFYKKSFFKIFLPFFLVSMVYFAFDMFWGLSGHGSMKAILKTYFLGRYYNLWFMVVLMIIYFLVPFIIRAKEAVSDRAFCVFACVSFAFAILTQLTGEGHASYNLDASLPYLSYFLMGNVIYERLRGRVKAFPFAIAAFVFYVLWIILRYKGFLKIFGGISVYFSPLCILSAVSVFIFFSNISVPFSLGRLPRKTYFIYLFHVAVYRAIFYFLDGRYIVDEFLSVWVVSTATFIISLILASIFLRIWEALEKKFNWKEKFYNAKDNSGVRVSEETGAA